MTKIWKSLRNPETHRVILTVFSISYRGSFNEPPHTFVSCRSSYVFISETKRYFHYLKPGASGGSVSPQQNETKTRVIKTCIERKNYNKNCRVRNGNERTGWATSSKFPLCVSSVSLNSKRSYTSSQFYFTVEVFARRIKVTSPQSCVWDDNFQSKRYLYKVAALFCGKASQKC